MEMVSWWRAVGLAAIDTGIRRGGRARRGRRSDGVGEGVGPVEPLRRRIGQLGSAGADVDIAVDRLGHAR